MKIIKEERFDEERALYGANNLLIDSCKFDGPADGESALKESSNIKVKNSYFNLRYPFWHDNKVIIDGSTLTDRCRAALWYSKDIRVNDSCLYGIKMFRECKNIAIKDTKISSPEFGWKSEGISLVNCTITGSEYLFFESKNISIKKIDMDGKYSFQYVKNMIIENSILDTKDAFWHTKNVTVKNSTIIGQYLGWYSEGLTLINCKIVGTQPLCYCKKLKLIDCKMIDTDLAFEYSDVEATIKGSVDSIKNPKSGHITAKKIKKIIRENSKYKSKCIIEEINNAK